MNTRILTSIILGLLLCFVTTQSIANEVSVSNISLTGQDTDEGSVLVQFDISWENSWRVIDANTQWWDAVWVFVKFRIPGDTGWQHASLNNQGHSSGSGTSALVQTGLIDESQPYDEVSNPGMGAFLYRSGLGSGTFTASGAQLQWNYSSDGVSDTDLVDVQVFAIEMVHVPEGSFYVGDGNSSSTYSEFYEGNSPGTPFQITSEDAIQVGQSTGQIFSNGKLVSGTIPSDFPKGFGAFYVMKYSVTQQQYVDFLNSLTTTQAESRFRQEFRTATNDTELDSRSRNKLSVTDGLYETELPFVPLHRISAREPWAYASWSSMRIMTELEYEKASRGPLTPVQGEYAWGTIQINEDRYTVGNQDEIDEFIASNYNLTRGNAIYRDTQFFVDGQGDNLGAGAARVGIFANTDSDRITSGASYYGIMELSGNVSEFVVSLMSSWEITTTGIHGDGSLDSEGNHTFSIGEIQVGSKRGGDFTTQSQSFVGLRPLRISARAFLADQADTNFDIFSSNSEGAGFRTVRTAPSTPAQ